MRYDRRLQTLTRQLGLECPRHGTWLICRGCDRSGDPLPETLSTALQHLIDGIVARVGCEGVQAAWRRLPTSPPVTPCGRCGGPRHCASCQESFGRRWFREIGLTDDEQRGLDRLLATCRRLQASPSPLSG